MTALLALLLDLVFVLVAFVARTVIQRRRTGDAGWRLGRPHGPAEAVGRALMFASAALLVVGLAAGAGTGLGVRSILGAAVAACAVALVAVAQLQMGRSWRIGVDPGERTELVRSGLYAEVRNPIYTGMVVFALGQAVMLPSAWTVAAVVAMAVGVQLQVRAVEEPYLVAAHGPDFLRWAEQAGRFVPRVGRLDAPANSIR